MGRLLEIDQGVAGEDGLAPWEVFIPIAVVLGIEAYRKNRDGEKFSFQ